MSYIVKSGSPFLRYFDPMAPQVNPRGLQPASSYIAPLAYATGQTDSFATPLPAPPDGLSTQILLFGCDYPQRFTGTQYYGETYLADGSPTNIIGLSFNVPAILPYGLSGISIVPDLIPVQTPAAAKFQEKISGPTQTGGVNVTGFPFFAGLLTHGLWQTSDGQAGDRATYSVELNMALESITTNGPAPFLELDGETLVGRQPIILWEPDFTQQIVDDGFKITAVDFNGIAQPYVLDVVGIWSGIYFDGEEPVPYSPVPRMVPMSAPADDGAGAKPAHPYLSLFKTIKGKV